MNQGMLMSSKSWRDIKQILPQSFQKEFSPGDTLILVQ